MEWTQEQVTLFATVLSHIKYDDSSAATALINSLIGLLTSNPIWDETKVELFDELLDHALFVDENGNQYADALIAALGG